MQILHPFAGSLQQFADAIYDPDRHRPNAMPESRSLVTASIAAPWWMVDLAFDGVIQGPPLFSASFHSFVTRYRDSNHSSVASVSSF